MNGNKELLTTDKVFDRYLIISHRVAGESKQKSHRPTWHLLILDNVADVDMSR
jgi:hypothetical protein